MGGISEAVTLCLIEMLRRDEIAKEMSEEQLMLAAVNLNIRYVDPIILSDNTKLTEALILQIFDHAKLLHLADSSESYGSAKECMLMLMRSPPAMIRHPFIFESITQKLIEKGDSQAVLNLAEDLFKSSTQFSNTPQIAIPLCLIIDSLQKVFPDEAKKLGDKFYLYASRFAPAFTLMYMKKWFPDRPLDPKLAVAVPEWTRHYIAENLKAYLRSMQLEAYRGSIQEISQEEWDLKNILGAIPLMLEGDVKPTSKDLQLTEEIFNSLIQSTVDTPMSFVTLSKLSKSYKKLQMAWPELNLTEPIGIFPKEQIGSALVIQAKEQIESLNDYTDNDFFLFFMERNDVLESLSPEDRELVHQAGKAIS